MTGVAVVLCPDNAVRKVDHAAGRFMDAADIKHELAVHENPHVIVTAVLECNRLCDVIAFRIDKLGFHRHAEVVIVTVSVVVRVFSRIVIGIEREETDLEARVHRFAGIDDRISVAVKFDVVDITGVVVVVVDDIKSALKTFRMFFICRTVSVNNKVSG